MSLSACLRRFGAFAVKSLRAHPAAPVTTVDQAGFLSSEISSWIERHKSNPRCREWFVLAGDLNHFLQKAITMIKAPSDDSQIFNAVLLFLRGVSSFQGTILLAERGMTNDARTLVRSCFETLFYLRAVLEDPKFAEALIRDDADRRSKLANILLQLPDGSGLEHEHRARLDRFLNNLEAQGIEREAIKIFEAARLAKLEPVYHTYYRGLSNDAAHPSVTSLNRHLKANEIGKVIGFHWGPDAADVEDTINKACTAAIYLASCAQRIVGEHAVFAGLDRCWVKYKSLIDGLRTSVPWRTKTKHSTENSEMTQRNWASREEWAENRRKIYFDQYDQNPHAPSKLLSAYASPDEVEQLIASLKRRQRNQAIAIGKPLRFLQAAVIGHRNNRNRLAFAPEPKDVIEDAIWIIDAALADRHGVIAASSALPRELQEGKTLVRPCPLIEAGERAGVAGGEGFLPGWPGLRDRFGGRRRPKIEGYRQPMWLAVIPRLFHQRQRQCGSINKIINWRRRLPMDLLALLQGLNCVQAGLGDVDP
jgi:hypothetical protein